MNKSLSLRSRQFASALLIVVIGIIVFGSLLYYISMKQKLADEQMNFAREAERILETLNVNDGRFYIPEARKKSFSTFLLVNEYSEFSKAKFAYIEDLKTHDIIWHSQYPDSDLSILDETNDSVTLHFKLHTQTGDPKLQTIADKNHIPSDSLSKDYLVYAKNLTIRGQGEFQLVIAKNSNYLDLRSRQLLQDIILLFMITTVLVLLAQLVSSYMVIQPIQHFAKEIKSIEAGEQNQITKHYPTELSLVKSAINALLNSEKGQKQRYRDALDDLAHSLKTPLSVLQGSKGEQHVINNQVQRMNDIIAYQLRRAVVSQQGAMTKKEPIKPVLFRLKETLVKVHRDKEFNIKLNIDDSAMVRMDKDDIMEVFGNLMNNACRFCDKLVELTANQNGDMLVIDIDDDGLGFPQSNPSDLLQRGIRADSQSEGQGIGLAVSTEIVEALGGKIELLMSPYVGARVRLHLPT